MVVVIEKIRGQIEKPCNEGEMANRRRKKFSYFILFTEYLKHNIPSELRGMFYSDHKRQKGMRSSTVMSLSRHSIEEVVWYLIIYIEYMVGLLRQHFF